jgi:hypothetical protein
VLLGAPTQPPRLLFPRAQAGRMPPPSTTVPKYVICTTATVLGCCSWWWGRLTGWLGDLCCQTSLDQPLPRSLSHLPQAGKTSPDSIDRHVASYISACMRLGPCSCWWSSPCSQAGSGAGAAAQGALGVHMHGGGPPLILQIFPPEHSKPLSSASWQAQACGDLRRKVGCV